MLRRCALNLEIQQALDDYTSVKGLFFRHEPVRDVVTLSYFLAGAAATRTIKLFCSIFSFTRIGYTLGRTRR